MRIIFTIRFHYKEDDPRFEWRYNHFVKNVLPRIQAQTYKDFDVYVWCNEWHKELFTKLGLNTFNVKNEIVRYKQHKYRPNVKYFHDFLPYSECIGLPKADIQCGIDSDDYIEPDYLQKIVDEVEKRKDKSVHVCFIPQMLRLETGEITEFPEYNERRGSAFMALYQPNKENYRFIYEESHISIIRKADVAVVLPRGCCYAVAHSVNESTGK